MAERSLDEGGRVPRDSFEKFPKMGNLFRMFKTVPFELVAKGLQILVENEEKPNECPGTVLRNSTWNVNFLKTVPGDPF